MATIRSMPPLLISTALLACTAISSTDSAASDPCADAHDVDWYSFGDPFFATYCRGCHSATAPYRYGAPEAVNFDTEEDARTYVEEVRRTVLQDGTMPVGGGVLDDDLTLLAEYLDCGV